MAVTALRLVGMTQGARRRWARRIAAAQDSRGSVVGTLWRELAGRPPTPENLREILAGLNLPLLAPAMQADLLSRSRWLQPRSAWRIGQRLRPCPGCAECEVHESEAMYFGMGSLCDGSGAVPAGRAKLAHAFERGRLARIEGQKRTAPGVRVESQVKWLSGWDSADEDIRLRNAMDRHGLPRRGDA